MRNELEHIRLIDRYLFDEFSAEDRQAFEATLLQNEALANKVETQRLSHRLIRRYGRREVRQRLEDIHQKLLEEAGFAHQLKTIFS